MRPSARKTVFTGLAGLSLAGAVAGCAPSAGGNTPAGDGTPSTGTGATYKDGTYSADGNYVSPHGVETVGVQLTLASGTVTDVKITEHPSNANTRKFQGEFAGGIAERIVGRNIDELDVKKVAGSSLTSGGFNEALEKIKSQAQ